MTSRSGMVVFIFFILWSTGYRSRWGRSLFVGHFWLFLRLLKVVDCMICYKYSLNMSQSLQKFAFLLIQWSQRILRIFYNVYCKMMYCYKYNNVEFNVSFYLLSRCRWRGKRMYATLPKGARYCHGMHAPEIQMQDSRLRSQSPRPLGHNESLF